MSQNDFNIANQGFPATRADLNSALQALASNSSGATAPATTYAYQWWYDTSTDILKMRNGANDAWINIASFDQANNEWLMVAKTSLTGSAVLPSGTTAQRDGSPAAGYTRWNTTLSGLEVYTGTSWASVGSGPRLFSKANTAIVAFTKTGAGTAETATEIYAEVNGSLLTVASGTSITMPSLTAGTDYAIWLATGGTLSATTSFTVPPSAGARHIGGFHYAPGGNAAAMAGGDTTPQINEYSFWDLKFRPACPDPRGMTLVAGGFWCDIYLLGVDHLINGTSKYNVPIADGSSPPRRPTLFGGDGTATYSTLTWWEAAEVMASHGKRLLSYADFAAAAYGTTENSSGGTDPGSTILRQAYTSKWGLMLATGNMYVWGDEFGGGAAGAAWANINGGRGQVYQQENALILGGDWANAAFSGSRASNWSVSPSSSGGVIGARGRCEHLSLV